MGRLERYILMTAGSAFIGVLLVLTSMIWLTTALRRFELLTSQGQTVWIFFSVTGLSLPTLMVVIAPIALFIAIAYTLNKLNSDSELIVMGAAGVSPWRVFRAPLALAVVVSLLTLAVTADISPRSLRTLREQLANVNADIVSNVAVPGRFTTIERGLTFHVRERGPGGLLLGIFIDDTRNPAQTTTYLADRGRIVPSKSGLFLVLEQGTLHRGSSSGNSAIVAIDRYAFDLSQAGSPAAVNISGPNFMTLSELIWPAPEDDGPKQEPGRYRVELHKRLSAPLYPIAAFVIAFAFLGTPRTTRQSRGLAIGGAAAAFMAVEIAGLGSAGFVERSALAAPLPYLVPIIGTALCVFTIAGDVEPRVPAPLQRFADALAARIERLNTA